MGCFSGLCCCKGKGKRGSQGKSSHLKDAIDGKKKLCVWMLGGPGSGKGTQCAKLKTHFQLSHLSTGDLLREIVKEHSAFANEVRATMERGALVDTDTVLKLLTKAMEEAYPNCKGYLIDGYPREVEQGELFCDQIGKPHVIIYLECPDEILIERLLKRGQDSGRADDNEETIKARLKTFHGISKPVIDRWKSKVVKVDSTRSPSEVEKECIKVIQNIIKDFKFS